MSTWDRHPRRLLAAAAALLLVALGGAYQAGRVTMPEPSATAAPAGDMQRRITSEHVDTTCTDDVTGALQAIIDSTPDGAVTAVGARWSELELAPGCYRVDGTLLLTGRQWLRLAAHGATFRTQIARPEGLTAAQLRTRAMVRIRGGQHLAIRGLTIQGPHPAGGVTEAAYVAALEAQHAFDVLGAQHVELGEVTATDVYGDFVYVGPYSEQPATDVWVHDSTFARNGRQCLAVTWAERVLFERLDVSQCRRATLDVEPNFMRAAIRDVTLRDSRIGPGRLLFLAMGGVAAPVVGVTVERNTLTGKGIGVIVLACHTAGHPHCVPPGTLGVRSNIVIRDNVSDLAIGGPSGAAIGFSGADTITVTGNTQPLQPGRDMYLAGLTRVCGSVTVAGNTIPGGVGQSKIVEPCPSSS